MNYNGNDLSGKLVSVVPSAKSGVVQQKREIVELLLINLPISPNVVQDLVPLLPSSVVVKSSCGERTTQKFFFRTIPGGDIVLFILRFMRNTSMTLWHMYPARNTTESTNHGARDFTSCFVPRYNQNPLIHV